MTSETSSNSQTRNWTGGEKLGDDGEEELGPSAPGLVEKGRHVLG